MMLDLKYVAGGFLLLGMVDITFAEEEKKDCSIKFRALLSLKNLLYQCFDHELKG